MTEKRYQIRGGQGIAERAAVDHFVQETFSEFGENLAEFLRLAEKV